MTVMWYDGSFEGLLSAVFDVYEYRFAEPLICAGDAVDASLFAPAHIVQTDAVKARRVQAGLAKIIPSEAIHALYASSLSEIDGIENVILRYIQYVFRSKGLVDQDYSNSDVLMVAQTCKKVHREKHRMEAFIRFQRTMDNLYYAIISPDFNVLPLLIPHFRNRYADQRWLIYDVKRKEGVYYDMEQVTSVKMTFDEQLDQGKNIVAIHNEKEELYQDLWRQYFSSVNIAARKNMPLHIRHMPLRYWRYLPEKQPRTDD